MEFRAQERRILRNALKDIPQFLTDRERRVFIRNTLDGYPMSAEINNALGFLDWQGSPIVVADELIRLLEGHEVAPDIPALGLIAQAIEPMAGLAHQDELADLRRHMGWGASLTSAPANTWHDQRPVSELVQERIIGENTLRPMYYLRRALRAADAVVRVDINGQPQGTGFLLASNLMMTNNHVIGTEEQARNSQAVFFFDVRDPESTDQDSVRHEVTAGSAKNPNLLLYTNADLDFTLIRLVGAPPLPLYLRARPVVVEQNQRVVIIQHPGGYPKQISLQNNLVAMANDRIVQYYTSTRAGSSGSPVLDDAFAVVAIHHSSVHNKDWDGAGARLDDPKQSFDRQFRNQGSSMVAVIKDLQTRAPALRKELTVVSQ